MQETYVIRSAKTLKKLKDMPVEHFEMYGVELISIVKRAVTVSSLNEIALLNFGAAFAARNKS